MIPRSHPVAGRHSLSQESPLRAGLGSLGSSKAVFLALSARGASFGSHNSSFH